MLLHNTSYNSEGKTYKIKRQAETNRRDKEFKENEEFEINVWLKLEKILTMEPSKFRMKFAHSVLKRRSAKKFLIKQELTNAFQQQYLKSGTAFKLSSHFTASFVSYSIVHI
jgi:hypothetical protein